MRRDDAVLREILRRGDPVRAEGGLGEGERAGMRARILRGAGTVRRRRVPRLRAAMVAGSVLLLATGVLWIGRRGRETAAPQVGSPAPGPRPPVGSMVPASRPAAPDDLPGAVAAPPRPGPALLRPAPGAPPPGEEVRQIEFTAPGGTRILWRIDPEFEL